MVGNTKAMDSILRGVERSGGQERASDPAVR
jgi:hypothetical protein